MNPYEQMARQMLAKNPNLQQNKMIANAISCAEKGDINGTRQIATNLGGNMGADMQKVLSGVLQQFNRR